MNETLPIVEDEWGFLYYSSCERYATPFNASFPDEERDTITCPGDKAWDNHVFEPNGTMTMEVSILLIEDTQYTYYRSGCL